MPHTALTKQSKLLEDLFFMKEDAKLLQHRAELQKLQATKEELSKASGIKDEAVLDRFIKMNVRPETAATLALVPLIEIAWADGKLDEKEKKVIIQFIDTHESLKNSIHREIITQWLSRKPEKELLEAWIFYARSLMHDLPDQERDAFKTGIIEQARKIAEASGGFLGLGRKISPKEKQVLDTMAKAFDHKRSTDP